MHKDLLEFGRRLSGEFPHWVERKPDDTEFSRIALDLFSLQIQHNTAYGRLCANKVSEKLTDWRQIPAVPTLAFKELEMTSLPLEHRTTVFSSSGTTRQKRSRHFHSLDSLGLYEASLLQWFRHAFREEMMNARWLVLTPSAHDAPMSSLAHMFSTIAARLRRPESLFAGLVDFNDVWSLNFDKASCVTPLYA